MMLTLIDEGDPLKLTPAQKQKMKASIAGNPHLFSARSNHDYMTIGIEIAPEFPTLTRRSNFKDARGNKHHYDGVPQSVVAQMMEEIAQEKAAAEAAAKSGQPVPKLEPEVATRKPRGKK